MKRGALSEWTCDANDMIRNATGFGGLVNPGCVCYMLSTLQQVRASPPSSQPVRAERRGAAQFFMIPEFRQRILSAPCPASAEEKKDNVLYQLQLIFGQLKEG
jgi:hypothetical protein